ncbi:MAG: magnesium chelatase subunit D [Pseudomonadota bacterium]
MSEGEDGVERWANAMGVAALLCVDPFGLGGVRLRALPGHVRDTWLNTLHQLLPQMPWQRIPTNIRDDRLLGGLDLTATLRTGKAVAQRGLLAQADGGVIELLMAERLEPGVAARICACIDRGEIALEREGFRDRLPARFATIALDEGDTQAGESLLPALGDRLAFTVDLHAISWRDVSEGWFEPSRIAAARELAPCVEVDPARYEALASAGVALGVWSLRPSLFALRTARAAAALDQRDSVNDEDVSLAARLVLAPRATRAPVPVEDAPPKEEPTTPEQSESRAEDLPQEPEPAPPPSEDDEGGESEDQTAHQEGTLEEQVLEAAAAAIPQDVLRAITDQVSGTPSRGAGGKAGAVVKSIRRGRPIGSIPGSPADGARLAVLDTLRAAAPWQRLRRRPPPVAAGGETGSAPPLRVHGEDLRVLRLRQHSPTTTVFVVDASGSAALHRLAEAKGAVELLLAECYVRRDQVALVAFRGRDASVLLPPTRSLVRAKRELAGLPGGGGTPLAAGIDATHSLVEQIKRAGETAFVVLLTDGRANVARDGTGGRERAMEDALASARSLAQEGVPTVLIDVSRKAQAQAGRVADALNARYLLLPSASAAQLSQAIQRAGAPKSA